MRSYFRQLVDHEISRRDFSKSLAALGFSSTAISSLISSAAAAEAPAQAGEAITVQGTGGKVLAAVMKSAGIDYVFNSNSTGIGPFYDALGQQSDISLIIAVQEGQATAMAQGYELASGRVAALVLPQIGTPNATSNLYNAWKDRSCIAVFSDGRASRTAGRDGFQQYDDNLQVVEQFTKWRWQVRHPERIVEMSQRAIKLAGTPPGGPVYVRIPGDIMNTAGVEATIYPQSRFSVPVEMAPRAEPIEESARLLIEAENPVIHAGPEVSRAGAVEDLVVLADLLGVRVTQGLSPFCDFPNRHPLYAGKNSLGFPSGVGRPDVFLNLGAHVPDETVMGQKPPKAATLIHAQLDYDRIANQFPTDIAIAAGTRETIQALTDSVKSQVTDERLAAIREPRMARAEEMTARRIARREKRAQATWDNSPITPARLSAEFEAHLDEDAIIVVETGDGSPQTWMNMGPGRKTQIGPTTGYALGWGTAAAMGAKIAQPDRQVVSMVGDGAMLFGQLESLWTAARYEIPVIMVVFNNHSYDGERGRIKMLSRMDDESWKDMSCYLGSPDVNFAKIAAGFDIEGISVSEPGEMKAAIARAAAITREGRPVLMDVQVARQGPAAESDWYPEISIAARRERKV